MKKFLKTVFFWDFFYAFLKILTPYLMVLCKYLVGCTCQKSEKKCKYFEINLNGAIVKKSSLSKIFRIKIKKKDWRGFFSIFR